MEPTYLARIQLLRAAAGRAGILSKLPLFRARRAHAVHLRAECAEWVGGSPSDARIEDWRLRSNPVRGLRRTTLIQYPKSAGEIALRSCGEGGLSVAHALHTFRLRCAGVALSCSTRRKLGHPFDPS